MILKNWEKLPGILFAKAWYATGHVQKETYTGNNWFTEDEWNSCSLSMDPAGLNDILGAENAVEPSLTDLIESGRAKRSRVLWMVSARPPSEDMMILPASLIFPIEKRVANFLFSQALNAEREVKKKSTIVFSRKGGKEVSHHLLAKYTALTTEGLRDLKPDVPARTLKAGFSTFFNTVLQIL